MFVSYKISIGNDGEAPAVPVEAVIREGDAGDRLGAERAADRSNAAR